jgi:H+-translocating diphosphatase
MLTPLIVGILFGVETLSGLLAGVLVSGIQFCICPSCILAFILIMIGFQVR